MNSSFFRLRERGTTVSTEVLGGLTTFLTMAYIVVINPAILADGGMPFTAALTATCFGSAIMTAIMGLIANRPIALAPGMGLNAIVAYTLCLGAGVDWRVAMACVMVEGIVISLLVVAGLREAIMNAIPASLRHAIAIGIGLFIAFIGLKGGGLVVADETTLLALGDVTSPGVIVALVSVALAIVLYTMKVPGSLLVSILISTALAVPLGVSALPSSWDFGLDFSSFAGPFQNDPNGGGIAVLEVFLQPMLLLVTFSLLMSDFFDTMGSVLAVAKKGDFATKDGNFKDAHKILLIDAGAAAVGGFMGASSVTTYVESAAGATAGARTGLSNLVVAAAFLLCAFLSPLIGMVNGACTCGALVVVGYLIMTEVASIEWNRIELAFPAFLIIACIPLTYSITNGIGLGFISYCFIMVFQGKAKDVHPLMWAASAAFLVAFIFT